MLGSKAYRKALLAGLCTLFVAAPALGYEQKKPVKHPPAQQVPIKTSISVITASKPNPATQQPSPAPAAAQPETTPAPPAPPPTLAQMPAVPPTVEYQNGKLTIIAENSTLGDILRAVKQKSGAAIDVPPNATERVVIHMGPAPIHDVLVSLLDGSSFNYIVVGSPGDSNAVTRVVLSPKPPGGPEMASAAPPPQAAQPPMAAPQPFPGGRNFGNGAPEADADADTSDDADDQPQTPDQAPQADQQSPDADGQPGAPGVVKTPQQMLEELQRQQQQQQLIQQQQQGIEGATPIGAPPNSAQQ